MACHTLKGHVLGSLGFTFYYLFEWVLLVMNWPSCCQLIVFDPFRTGPLSLKPWILELLWSRLVRGYTVNDKITGVSKETSYSGSNPSFSFIRPFIGVLTAFIYLYIYIWLVGPILQKKKLSEQFINAHQPLHLLQPGAGRESIPRRSMSIWGQCCS